MKVNSLERKLVQASAELRTLQERVLKHEVRHVVRRDLKKRVKVSMDRIFAGDEDAIQRFDPLVMNQTTLILEYIHKKTIRDDHDMMAVIFSRLMGVAHRFGNKKLDLIAETLYRSSVQSMQECMRVNSRDTGPSEAELQRWVVKKFDQLFPKFTFEQEELRVRNGRIDVFARTNRSDKPVVMELKKGNRNPTRQLLAYAECFDDPILVSVTHEPVLQHHRSPRVRYYHKDGNALVRY